MLSVIVPVLLIGMLAPHLVGHPLRHRGLAELLDLRRLVSLALCLQLLRQLVARGDELLGRNVGELINVVLHRSIGWHGSSCPSAVRTARRSRGQQATAELIHDSSFDAGVVEVADD